MTTRLFRGSLWYIGGQGMSLIVTMVATPFVIRSLGTESYGVLALINLLLGQLSFADLGTGQASTRFAAGEHARGDDEGEAAVIWSSLVVMAVPTLLTASVLILGAPALVASGLRLPLHLRGPAALALQVTALGFAVQCLANILDTPELVRMRFDLATLINSGVGIIQIALMPLVLLLGGGLVQVAMVITGSAVARAVLHGAVAQWLLPSLRRPRLHPEHLRALIHFGVAITFSALASIVLASGEKFLLTRFGSVTELAYYSVAFSFVGLLNIVPTALSQSLLPAASRFQRVEDRNQLQDLYRRILRVILIVTVPSALLLCTVSKPFFILWAGPEFGRESTLPFYILVGGLVINVIAFVPYKILIALGQTGLIARYHWLELLPYLAGTTLLVVHFGAVGAALAWSLRQFIAVIWLLVFVQRRSGLHSDVMSPNALSFAAALAVLLAPVVLLSGWLPLHPTLGSRLIALSLSSFLYGRLIWTRVLDPEERRWLETAARSRLLAV